MKNARTKRIIALLCALCIFIPACVEAFTSAAGLLTRTLTASDGNRYRVTVRYNGDAGIPEGAELSVKEIPADSAEYVDYLGRSAEALGKPEPDISLARAFDIRLENPVTGETYRPRREVSVNIRLLDADPGKYDALDVVHFHGDDTSVLESAFRDEGVSFDTDGFSVYVLVGSEPGAKQYKFVFLDLNPLTQTYAEVPVYNDRGQPVYSQTIRDLSELVIPQRSDPERGEFAEWYEGSYQDGQLALEKTPFDFSNFQSKGDEFTLYAVYRQFHYATFHGQYDAAAGIYPVSCVLRAVPEAEGQPAKVRIDNRIAAYTSSGNEQLAFQGWSYTPIQTPGSPTDASGAVVSVIQPDADGYITVDKNTDLYPVYRKMNWLTFYTAQTGLSASYVPPAQYFEGECAEGRLPVTSREGYEFQGWYTGRLDVSAVNGETVETVAYYAKITDSNGALLSAAGDAESAVYVTDGKLYLRRDATLYARWTANYEIKYWKESTTDSKTYEYIKSETVTGVELGAQASIPSEKVAENCPNGFLFDDDDVDAPKTIANSKDITVLNVYYKKGSYIPKEGNYTLSFVDSANPDRALTEPQTVAYGADLAGLAPTPPESSRKSENGRTVFQFSGWYVDPECEVRANPDANGSAKVLGGLKMPDHDLTLYAGWESIKFRVDIDPNYGALYDETGAVGTGATYFNSTYDAEPIGEYTHVTRDYVPSSSGTYYYVNQDRAYGDGAKRKTFYTTDPSLATEDTTFEHAPGTYTYMGWYEVLRDDQGNELGEADEPYDFTRHTDHPTKLRLHWQKKGVYYLSFSTGENSTIEDENPTGYTDCAEIVLTQTAAAPSGSTFVGWKLKGSTGGRLYAPGESFTLRAEDAARISSRETVSLEAVYARADTARIVYDANGGKLYSDAVNYGSTFSANYEEEPLTGLPDPVAGTATVSGLSNNARVRLSDGTGFSREGAEFMGWSDAQICTPDAAFFPKSSTDIYGVDSREPDTLYAVWGVTVNYHLNCPDGANWGGDWDSGLYTLNGDTYTRTAYLGAPLDAPEKLPAYTGTEGKIFRWWATEGSAEAYDFTQPLAGPLDLYACWDTPGTVGVHAVDASAETLAEPGWDLGRIQVRTEETPLTGIAREGYAFAFYAAASSLAGVSDAGTVTHIKYDTDLRQVCVRYAGQESYTPLPEGTELYAVYYQQKELTITYQAMDNNGILAPVDAASTAPNATGLLGEYNMSTAIPAPLNLVNGYTHCSFAIGSAKADSANHLTLITKAADKDANAPALRIRNTWRGFQYSEDSGNTWVGCGYTPSLYVVYFESRPTIVTFSAQTIGLPSVKQSTKFQYRYRIYLDGDADPRYTSDPIFLQDGEAYSTILFQEETGFQRVEVEQEADERFTTAVGGEEARLYNYTAAADDPGTVRVTFTNTHKFETVEVHLARVESEGTEGGILRRDSLRTENAAAYSFDLPMGERRTVLEALDSDGFFPGLTADGKQYAFGVALSGSKAEEGKAVAVDSMGVASIAYEQTSDGYALALRDASGSALGTLGDADLYFLYYPMPVIRYVKEDAAGNLTPVTGSTLVGGVSEPAAAITYHHAPLTMNGSIVEQGQHFQLSLDGFVISQQGNHFRMPAVLDDGIFPMYLSYTKLGAGGKNAQNLSDLGSSVTDGLSMRLEIRNNALQYSFDGAAWFDLPLADTPTIYAIYTERGYDLQINKVVDTNSSGADPLFTNASFPVTISSHAITRSRYASDDAADGFLSATPAANGKPGAIALTVRDGTSVRIQGLAKGIYTITEAGNENYSLTAKKGRIVAAGSTTTPVTNNTSVTFPLDQETRVDLTNAPKALCRITDTAGEHLFYTLRSATAYVEDSATRTAEVEMLTDYLMPAADTMQIPSGCQITLITPDTAEKVYRITRTEETASVPLFANNGSLTLRNLILDGDGKRVTASAPLVYSTGALTVEGGAAIRNANSSVSGGAVCCDGGTLLLNGGTLSGNTAPQGGAIYYAGNGSVTLAGMGTVQGNTATSGNGGGIYATGGSITLTGASALTGNTAPQGMGGGLYADSAFVTVEQHAAVTKNSALSGGALCVGTGTVVITATKGVAPPEITENTAAGDPNEGTGSGGALWLGGAALQLSGGTLSGNTAAANGGAVYIESGAATLGGAELTVTENQAANGAAVYFASGKSRFTGGSFTQNTATAGGAVGVGSAETELTFSGDVVIRDNTLGDGQTCNVYLDQDSETVLNVAGLGSGAYLGIHVPDALTERRNVPGARFASYSSNDNMDRIHSDHDQYGFDVQADTVRRTLYWGKALSVQVRYLASFSDGLPPVKAGEESYANAKYYPDLSAGAFSELAEELFQKYSGQYNPKLNQDSVYAVAFLDGAAAFRDYITQFYWDAASAQWMYRDRVGTPAPLGDRQIVIYYAQSAYLSFENNTDAPLTISALTAGGHGVANTANAAGYGTVYAKNGSVRSALLPVTAEDLTLAPGTSLNLLLPGGRNAKYTLTGAFTTESAEQVRVRQTGKAETAVNPAGFTLDGVTLNGSGACEIIFGDDKRVCKIQRGDAETVFSRISDALSFAKENNLLTVTIEMLTDYLLPGTDKVEVPAGYKVTLTTAESYEPSDPAETRATISRDGGNSKAMITSAKGSEDTALILENLIFDVKGVQGNTEDGAVKTEDCSVTATNLSFKNLLAHNGGAIFAKAGMTAKNSFVSVDNCTFEKCHSTKKETRDGGGAIHAYVRDFTVSNSHFTDCDADWQAGAVFHRIDGDYVSSSTITNCTFTNCEANAAGGLELDSKTITVTDCTFRHCVAKERNGGGFNAYALNNDKPIADCSVTVERCTFDDCHADHAYTKDNYGGGFRSTAKKTTVKDCNFTNCSSRFGGAIGISNNQAGTIAVIEGGTITNCKATTNDGGGIYSLAEQTTVRNMEISNCSSVRSGGGIYANGKTSLLVSGCTLSRNSAGTDGGGIHSNAMNVSVTGSAVSGNTAVSNGGGIYTGANKADGNLTLADSKIQGNTAGSGGGIYAKTGVTLEYGAEVTENRLAANIAENAAGIYMLNNMTFSAGKADATEEMKTRPILVRENTTAAGVASNLRLWQDKNVNHKNSVRVYSDLIAGEGAVSEIRVVNAKNVGTEFGVTSTSAGEPPPRGLTDTEPVFRADASTLHGVLSRMTENAIVWTGEPVCKLTDEDGNLLYFDAACTDPAIFDRLDAGGNNGIRASAFSYLRGGTRPALYLPGAQYLKNSFCVKMLVENYELFSGTTLAGFGSDKEKRTVHVTLTTADTSDALYPYKGRQGGRASIVRAAAFDAPMIKANTNLTMKNIVLDGNNISVNSDGGIILITDLGGIRVRLEEDAILQNSATAKSGGAVYVGWSDFELRGGTIRNCSAGDKGGAVYMISETKSDGDAGRRGYLEFESGSVVDCRAKNGGGVALEKGTFTMSGAVISRCTAEEAGGGVWLSDNSLAKPFQMSGGNITYNSAKEHGGGIAFAGTNARIYFSGMVNVAGNTCDNSVAPGKACNLELNVNNSDIINTSNSGLAGRSYVGVYVPGNRDDSNPGNDSEPYASRGGNGDVFGKYAKNSRTATLYCFVNDRNGLKGGLAENQSESDRSIHWVRIYALKVTKLLDPEDPDSEEEFSFTVNLRGKSSNGQPDAYRIDSAAEPEKYGEMFFISNQTDTTTATFKLKAGESITAVNLSDELKYEVIENLTTEQEKKYAVLPALVVTGTVGENKELSDTDPYTSEVIITNVNPVCKITDAAGNLLYRKAELGVGNNKKQYFLPAVFSDLTGDNGAVHALENNLYRTALDLEPYRDSALQIQMLRDCALKAPITLPASETRSITLTTARTDAAQFPAEKETVKISRGYSGGSMIDLGGNLTLKTLVLDGAKEGGYSADTDGGIVHVKNKATLKFSGGATLQNSATSKNGGAVYVSAGGSVEMTGGTVNRNQSDGDGAGIFLAEGGTLRLSGNPSFGGKGTDVGGNIVTSNGNWKQAALSFDATNGFRTYPRPRQDIYIAEQTADGEGAYPPASLVLTGNLDAAPGTIWVWAEHPEHYRATKPFARTAPGQGAALSDATYQAFRNARPDSETGNAGGSYLSAGSGTNAEYVYWAGGQDVRFRKIDGFGEPLAEAEFTLYTEYDCDESHEFRQGDKPARAVSVDGTENIRDRKGDRLEKGDILFTQIPEGFYFMRETGVPTGHMNAYTKDAEGKPIENIYFVRVGHQRITDNTKLNAMSEQFRAVYAGIPAEKQEDEPEVEIYLVTKNAEGEPEISATQPDIASCGIIDCSTATRKVILQSVDGSNRAQSGKTYKLLYCDGYPVPGFSDGTPTGNGGVIWVGTLPYGKYELRETAPGNRRYQVTVNETGVIVDKPA